MNCAYCGDKIETDDVYYHYPNLSPGGLNYHASCKLPDALMLYHKKLTKEED
jgi:hypothetical protein